MKRYNENITSGLIDVPLSTPASAPVTIEIPAYGGLLLNVVLFSLDSPLGKVFFRLRQSQRSLFPHASVEDTAVLTENLWCALPVGVLDVNMENRLEGPPWVVELDLFNADTAAHTVQIIIRSGSVTEQDINYRILQLLETLTLKTETQLLETRKELVR